MKVKLPSNKQLSKLNRYLLALIIAINGYVILSPLWPQAEYFVDTKITKPVSSELNDIDRSRDHMIIPKLQLDENIYEGNYENQLDKGIWRRPNTSTPDKQSNTVIVGHRFTYKNRPPFYHLNKLLDNDQIIVVYAGKIYDYKIFEKKITGPNDQTVEAASNEPRLTIYTCDPLWTAENRLVYTSSLEKIIQ